MLRHKSLFELIKTLDIHEKRYLMSKGKKSGDDHTAYTEMLDSIYRMKEYDKNELITVFSKVSKSKKLDVKKHYLYYWILNQLNEYHRNSYDSQRNIQNIQLLLDRSLIRHAQDLISVTKKGIINSENHLDILSLLEKELLLNKYLNESDSFNIMEEIEVFSNQYRDLKYLEFVKLKFRKILDFNMFTRSEVVESEINNLFRGKIDKLKISPDAFLLNFNYNLLFYWKFGSENNWTKAYKYALKNYKLLEENHEKINQFPEFTIHILYNLLNVASFAGKEIYRVALKKLKATILSIQNKRIKLDGLLYLHLSNLIHLNRNKPKLLESKSVEDAEKFIERNKQNFSHIRLNHFYFDLAKSYYYRNDFKKSFSILNEMYQNFYSKDYTIDFNTHSRFLYCLVCYELGEYELLRSTAKSIKDFMERNGILFKFEKRMIRFIMNDLPILLEKPVETRRKKIEKLKSDITLILESNYEKKVLNYFDYYFWIDSQAVRFNK